MLIVDNCFGQAPNWSLNPNNYQHSMTFTSFLTIDGKKLTSENDTVAAFIDGEVRGLANVTYAESRDKYVAFLTVFSNTNGKTISFKIYDSSNDVVIDIDTKVSFSIDGNLGGIFQSFSIANPVLNNDAEIMGFSFKDVLEKSVNISENKVDVIVPSTIEINSIIAQFTLSNGANAYANKIKQTTGISVQDYSDSFVLTILSEDESVLKEYQINVSKGVSASTLIVGLTSTTNSLLNKNGAAITLTLNEAVTNLSTSNFELINALIQSITKINETTYNLKLIALSQGKFSVKVPENAFLQSEAKENNASNLLDFTLDTKKPYLLSIQRKLPTTSITNANEVEFSIEFNEAVNNVSSNSFMSITSAEISVVKDSATSFFVKVTNIENYNGQVGLSLNSANTIVDIVGNALRISSLKNY